MRISSLSTASMVKSGTRARHGPSTTGLALPASETAAPPAAAPVGMIGLLALQDEDGPVRRDHAARRGGVDVLALLTRLQAASLDGPDDDMAALREAIDRMSQPVDPGLATILSAIRLRARIELARHGRM